LFFRRFVCKIDNYLSTSLEREKGKSKKSRGKKKRVAEDGSKPKVKSQKVKPQRKIQNLKPTGHNQAYLRSGAQFFSFYMRFYYLMFNI